MTRPDPALVTERFAASRIVFFGLRLNYAIDLRRGALHDVPSKVRVGTMVPLAMGDANAWWNFALFGYPRVQSMRMVDWVAQGRRALDKPTQVEVRDGQF